MRRTPRPLARRIDRLARHAHAFHRFAHHPLCERYRGELLVLGSHWRLCRGCVAAATGLVVGTCLGSNGRYSTDTELALLGCAVLLGLSSLKFRLGKILARFLPAMLASTGVVCATIKVLAGNSREAAIPGLGLLLAVLGFAIYRRRGPNRAACTNCPQRASTVPCSGIAPIVRRERAFRRLAQRWLDALPK